MKQFFFLNFADVNFVVCLLALKVLKDSVPSTKIRKSRLRLDNLNADCAVKILMIRNGADDSANIHGHVESDAKELDCVATYFFYCIGTYSVKLRLLFSELSSLQLC